MLDFGFSEIVLTSAIALVVLGPEKLPKVARQVGHWMGRARAMARQLSDQLEREVNAEELLRSKPLPPPLAPDPQPFLGAHLSPSPPPAPLPPAVGETPVYSSEPAAAPDGADWQPAPENKASNG